MSQTHITNIPWEPKTHFDREKSQEIHLFVFINNQKFQQSPPPKYLLC